MYPYTEDEYDKMEGNCFSQGVCREGAAILLSGQPVKVDDIVKMLNDYFKLVNYLKETIPVTMNKFDPKITDLVSDHFEELLS